MTGGYRVLPLRCATCGADLPVMGQIVAFRCERCFSHWILAGEGLVPLAVHRARVPGDEEEEIIHLPFWLIEIERARLAALVEETLAAGRVGSAVAAAARHLVAGIEAAERWRVHVPAFHAPNPAACLTLGRLFTGRQPAARIERAEGPGRAALCAMRAADALLLADVVFLAHLPGTVGENPVLAGALRVEPAAAPWLVEYPFARRGPDLVSLAGGIAVPMSMIAPKGTRPPAAPAGRK